MTANDITEFEDDFVLLLKENKHNPEQIICNSTCTKHQRLGSCGKTNPVLSLSFLLFGLCNIGYLLHISMTNKHTDTDNSDDSLIFVDHFQRAFLAGDPLDRPEKLVPFILSNEGKLLCHRSHKELMRNPSHIIKRTRAIVETVYSGVSLLEEDALSSHKLGIGLPVLVKNGDRSGCNFTKQHDSISFPRLTWSVPATKYATNNWCNAVPMTSYANWQSYHNKHKSHSSWDFTFNKDSHQYPWADKVNKAVWRGTTTHDKVYWGQHLNETPRGKLVKRSIEHPDLIDAGFVNIIQQYADQKEELANQTRLVDRMKSDNYMKFKAIIDIGELHTSFQVS